MEKQFVRLTECGERRVLNGIAGMTFMVDKFTPSCTHSGLNVAHVRDYRFSNGSRKFQIWSLGPEDYTFLPDDPDRPSWEKFSAKEWALALQGLTPGGSEFLTPAECVAHVRKRTDYPRMIIELREQKAAFVGACQLMFVSQPDNVIARAALEKAGAL